MSEDELRRLDKILPGAGCKLEPKCSCKEIPEELEDGEARYRWKYCPYCGSKIFWSVASTRKSTQ